MKPKSSASKAQASGSYLHNPQIISSTQMPVGSIILWPTDNDLKTANDTEEWMICDGRELPTGGGLRQDPDYKLLWEIIGLSFGPGVDPHFFKLPDLRGMFVRGTNTAGLMGPKKAPWYDPNAGARQPLRPGGVGDEVGSLQKDEIKQHTHSVQTQAVSAGNAYTVYGQSGGTTSVGPTGGAESRPINVYLNYLIKAKQKSPTAG